GTSVTAGPERRGPSMADGGSAPTLIDAFNVKKLAAYGDTAASEKGVRALAKKSGRSPEDLAGAAIDYAMRAIKEASDAMVRAINEKPVYTVHEVLEGKTIVPKRLYVMGGPARAFSDALAKRFGLPITVPEQYAVANAVGAALTHATMDIELFADTERGVMLIPFLNVNERVSGSYTLEHAKKDAQARLADHLAGLGVKSAECASEIIEAASFNMVGGWSTTGRNIRVKCQVKPGIVKGYRVG
ncbi:MAG TPA: hydantoinase/oxoprolinase family protein, partial [Spirochaetota bacterium]|nr:hydantoinase/oxoprolinase family protein [Spirochaetota bacterium]